jgi:hypothetical protein
MVQKYYLKHMDYHISVLRSINLYIFPSELWVYLYRAKRIPMFKNLLFVATLGLILSSCSTPEASPMGFQGEMSQRYVSLRLLLSEQFQLAPESNPTAVSSYRVDFDRVSTKSTIIDENSADTIYHGRASRNGGLWFLEYDQGNGTFLVGALKAEANHLLGWGQVKEQMQTIESKVKDGSLQYLIASRSGADNILAADQKILTPVYNEIVDASKKETVIVRIGKGQGGNDNVEEEDLTSFIRKVHPNPADKYFEVDLRSAGNYIVQVVDIQGTIVHESSMTTKEMSIDCTQFVAGSYNVVIRNAEDKKELGSKMLNVGR